MSKLPAGGGESQITGPVQIVFKSFQYCGDCVKADNSTSKYEAFRKRFFMSKIGIALCWPEILGFAMTTILDTVRGRILPNLSGP